MNVRNKIWMALFALGTILWGCDSLIYDDLADCPQGVYVKFYSMTPCDVDSAFIGQVPSLTAFAFGENGKLAAVVTEQNVTLSRDYEVLVPVSDGYYTFIGWAGINDQFTTAAFTPGVTTKKEVVLTLKSASGVAANLNGTHLWQGESPAVFLPDPREYASFFEHTAINLQEVTNRLKVVVEFDASITEVTPQDLAVALSSANGTMNIDGSMPLDAALLNYPVLNTVYTDNSVTWDFALMDLVTGYRNRLKLDYPAEDQVLFDGDLIGSILLNTLENNINLACENDFTVKFVLRDYCVDCWTHFSCLIYVNEWLVHYYDGELEI